MRVQKYLILFLMGFFLVGVAAAQHAVPTAVSPGATRGAGIAIADRCPTFSWGESAGARSYELTVYQVGDGGLEVRPVFTESIPATALSWTPSLARCLEAGGRYAWSVRAVYGDRSRANVTFSDWSEPSLFQVIAEPVRDGEGGRPAPWTRADPGAGEAAGAEAGESPAPESAVAASRDAASEAPAGTKLSVDGNVDADSFSGAGSALTGVDAETLDGVDLTALIQKTECDTEAELESLLGDVNVLTDDETAAAASALEYDGDNCPAGQFATGVDESGWAQGCAVPADAHAFANGNTQLGDGALAANTSGYWNTASGHHALYSNTSGAGNDASGHRALFSNTSGIGNAASGAFALEFNTTGSYNTACGGAALFSNTIGDNNTASGVFALGQNTEGENNTASGYRALYSNTTGLLNTASGYRALYSNTIGNDNTASGDRALHSNTEGRYNTASGNRALLSNTTGDENTASGFLALGSNTTGDENTASGDGALYSNTTGHHNTALGASAGFNATTGDDNIFIGSGALGAAADTHTIRIGGTTVGTGTRQQNRTFVNGIRGVTTGVADAVGVMIDSSGQLGTVSSSRRTKEDVRDMAEASERLLALRPVTFRYRKEFAGGEKPIQFGLIAEEVAEVFPELVVYNQQGEPETVKYHLLSSLLLNELQKLHSTSVAQAQAAAAQAREIERLHSEVGRLAALEARVRELEPLEARLERLEAFMVEAPWVAAERRPPPEARPGAR